MDMVLPHSILICSNSSATDFPLMDSVNSEILDSAIFMFLSALPILWSYCLSCSLNLSMFAFLVSLNVDIYCSIWEIYLLLSSICWLIPDNSVFFIPYSAFAADFCFFTSLHIKPSLSILNIFSIKALLSPIDKERNGLLFVHATATMFLKSLRLIPRSLSISSWVSFFVERRSIS